VPRPVHVETTVTVPYTPEQLWRYVADTQRMDRAVGLPRAHFTRVPRPEGGEIVTGEYRLGKRLAYARWQEHPFIWERPRHYSIVREYVRGPIVRFHGGAELESVAPENGSGERTTIHVFGEFTPRHPIFAPFIRWGVGRLHRWSGDPAVRQSAPARAVDWPRDGRAHRRAART
jgi:hypothetical protein